MTLKEKAIRGVAWSALESWANHFLSLLVFLLLARLLTPETFGLVALASVFVALLQVLAEQGFGQAIVQREQIDREHLDTAFWANLIISVTLAGLLYVTGPWIADGFKQPFLAPVLQWLSLGVVLNGLTGVHRGLLVRDFKFKVLAIRTIIATTIGGITGIVLAVADYGVWALVGQQLTNGLIASIILWISSDWRPGLRVSRAHFKDLFAFGSHVLGIQLLSLTNRRLDDLLIGAVLGPVALGIYTVAYKIFTTMTQLLVQTLSKVALPVFSRMQNEPARIRNAYYSAIQATATICIPAFVGVLMLAPDLIPLLFGQQWEKSVPVTQFLMIVGIVLTIGQFDGTLLLAAGKERWALLINLANTIGNVIAFVIAVRWGIVAVAAAFAIRALLIFPCGNYLVKRTIHIRYHELAYRLKGPFIGTVAIILAMCLIEEMVADTNQWMRLCIKMVVGMITYLVALYISDRVLFSNIRQLLITLLAGRKKPQTEDLF